MKLQKTKSLLRENLLTCVTIDFIVFFSHWIQIESKNQNSLNTKYIFELKQVFLFKLMNTHTKCSKYGLKEMLEKNNNSKFYENEWHIKWEKKWMEIDSECVLKVMNIHTYILYTHRAKIKNEKKMKWTHNKSDNEKKNCEKEKRKQRKINIHWHGIERIK